MHCWFGDNCDSRSTRKSYHFCSSHMDYGDTARFGYILLQLSFELCYSLSLTWTSCFSAFLLYVASVIVLVFLLICHFSPQCGHTNVMVFTGICSLMGSLSVTKNISTSYIPSFLYKVFPCFVSCAYISPLLGYEC